MRRLIIGLLAALLVTPALAQQAQVLLSGCGTASYGAGAQQLTMTSTGQLCFSGGGSTIGTVNQGTPNAGGATNAWWIQGAGVAGTPAGGVLTVQFPSSGGTATPAGTNIIGKFGIDQTTPGTTNGVQINAPLPAGTNAIGSITNTSFGATPVASATTNAAGTITTGGTFQQIAALNAVRKSLDFQNTNAAHACYLFFGASGETTTNSIVVSAGQEYLRSSGTIPSDRAAVTCTNTSDTFYFAVQ